MPTFPDHPRPPSHPLRQRLDEHRSIERSHRIDAEEFYRLLDGVVLGDIAVFNDKLKEWEDYYNYHRPHGGLGGQTPYERLLQKTQTNTQSVNDQRQ
nr:integrase core domain-containing protein [Amycolatopsis thermophila]